MTDQLDFVHVPVLIKETIDLLNLRPRTLIVDATLGGGGHARAMLTKAKTIELIGIDQDEEAVSAAKENLKDLSTSITYVKDNFSNIKVIAGNKKIDGILFDLGVSSHQIDVPERGFSFQADAPLDMRMDGSSKATAEDLINTLDQCGLEKIISDYGEERYFKRIASSIIKKRPISTTTQLADIIKFSIPKSTHTNTIKSIARVFQAFRIAVNDELSRLDKAIEDSIGLLAPKGRIVVISYHSLEDRIVKNIFKKASMECICPPELPKCVCDHKKTLKILTKKPITAGEFELRENPRARSAKLRAAEKI